MESPKAVAALGALAQESRLAIYRALIQAGPKGISAGKIGEAISLPPSTLSFHLKELLRSDLVNARQEGRFVIYAANFATMNDLLAFLTDNCCGGASCSPVCEPQQTGHEQGNP